MSQKTKPVELFKEKKMSALETISELDQRMKLIKNTICKDLSDNEFLLFINLAKARGLDVLLGQMHAIKRGGKVSYTISIDGLRALAARTKEYAGSDDPVLVYDKDGKLEKATVSVYRIVQGQKCSFTSTALWKEFAPSGPQAFLWNKMPTVMLSKVAEAHALRKGFSSDLGGLYVDEEMHQEARDVTNNEKTKQLTNRFATEEKPEKPEYQNGVTNE